MVALILATATTRYAAAGSAPGGPNDFVRTIESESRIATPVVSGLPDATSALVPRQRPRHVLGENLGPAPVPEPATPLFENVVSPQTANALTITPAPTFAGLTDLATPSDGGIAVSPSQAVVTVNTRIGVLPKAGGALLNKSLSNFFGITSTAFLTDPHVL